jgi:hypothetical protein
MTLYEDSAAVPPAKFDCIDWRDGYAIGNILEAVPKSGGGGVPRRLYTAPTNPTLDPVVYSVLSVSSPTHPIPLTILALTHAGIGLPRGTSTMPKRQPTRPIQALFLRHLEWSRSASVAQLGRLVGLGRADSSNSRVQMALRTGELPSVCLAKRKRNWHAWPSILPAKPIIDLTLHR